MPDLPLDQPVDEDGDDEGKDDGPRVWIIEERPVHGAHDHHLDHLHHQGVLARHSGR